MGTPLSTLVGEDVFSVSPAKDPSSWDSAFGLQGHDCERERQPPPPTASPTGRPTPVPTPKPTLPRLPSIVSDEVFGEDVFEEEDANEDVVKDDIIK